VQELLVKVTNNGRRPVLFYSHRELATLRPAFIESRVIEASILHEKLRNINALKQLIIMDACQSGLSVELLATRGASEEKVTAELSLSAAIHVMASDGSEQFTTELAGLGHGLILQN
jgi:hypothetical protein